ncbi:MAG: NAD(P)H-dependent oxidoreductase [Advenella sp.]|uniref:flavodoxin family protein n=1 Tax=Advenella sp. TaxID=1872388 RepID=UPI00258E61A0|nr:NAD(P)H-dependent oxidoreductase [Advenella sp.]MDD3757222.1 NAD(P)H-dependent oxidoreductase [Advenella sp.]
MDANTKTLLVIWHSRTNAAKLAAQAAFDAACKIRQELGQQDQILMLYASEVRLEQLLQADAYLFCAPENLASLSGAMKEFFDRFYYDLLGNIEGRPYSAIITAGSDGQGALRQLQRICTGWRLNEKVVPIILNTASQTKEEILAPKTLTAEQLAQAAEVGGTLYAWL